MQPQKFFFVKNTCLVVTPASEQTEGKTRFICYTQKVNGDLVRKPGFDGVYSPNELIEVPAEAVEIK